MCVKNSVHRGGLQAHTLGGRLGGLARGVSRPTHRGEVGGLVRGVVSRPTPGERLGGLAGGEVSRPIPGGSPGLHLGGSPGPHPGGPQAHTWGVSRPTCRGCIPPCTEAPYSRRLLLRAVRILLECILVYTGLRCSFISALHHIVYTPITCSVKTSGILILG